MKILLFFVIFSLFLLVLWAFVLLRCRGEHPDWARFARHRYAHRGLYSVRDGVPENSLPAFRRAVRHGFGSELDVHLLSDGTLAVFHDYDLRRMTSRAGFLEERTAADLKHLHLGGTAETIPELREVLSLYSGSGLPLIVELKPFRGNHRELTERTLAQLDRFRVPYCLESFDPRCLVYLRRHRPEIPRGQLAEGVSGTHGFARRMIGFLLSALCGNVAASPDFIAYRFTDRKNPAPRLCRALYGAPIVYWTIRSEAELASAKREGASAIFEGFVPDQTKTE